MAVRIAVGDENFEEIRNDGLYYVDKTELIYDLVGRTNNKVSLFTRPRRFGKTLNLSMMESFFDINRDSKTLFEGLAVSSHKDFCKTWMNQYPILFISFKDVDGLNFESAYQLLQSVLADYCKRIAVSFEKKSIDPADLTIFERLKYQNASLSDVKGALKTIMRMMYAAYGKPVILLIDEYDVPLSKASEKNTTDNRYYEQMLDVIRGMLSMALKTNEYLKFAVITGCLRIAKESIFTGTNNFASYSVLDEDFSRYFGFTQEEVDSLLTSAGLSDKAAVFQKWYDGYVFGDTHVYCPWDVVNYTSALLRRRDARPKNYWRNTSGNGVIREFVGRFKVSGKFETLMNGGTIRETISDELTYDILHETEQNLWSVLLMTGYLTKAGPVKVENAGVDQLENADTAHAQLANAGTADTADAANAGKMLATNAGMAQLENASMAGAVQPAKISSAQETDDNTVDLRIPNAEIAGIFQDTVAVYFRDTLDTSRQEALMEALWAGDTDSASNLMSDLLWRTISYMDYHEDYYHAFMAGLFVGRGYETESNKERGLGRPDLLLTDVDHRRAMIIEAKRSTSQAEMEKDCDKALQQIADKEYAKLLDAGYETVRCYGISFFRKTALIKML